MDSIKITVLETYSLKFCCVCTQNGANDFLNIFENVISVEAASTNLFSLAQILVDTLGLSINVSSRRDYFQYLKIPLL